MNQTRQYCTFYLKDLFFGVDVLKVQEVLCTQRMTRVPLSSATVQGLINLRGQIVTAIDLRRRLELPPRGEDQPPMNVVVRSDDGPVSLHVDEIGDVVELEPGESEPPPETLRGAARELVQAVYKMNGRLLLVLDIEKAVSAEPTGARTAERAERRAA